MRFSCVLIGLLLLGQFGCSPDDDVAPIDDTPSISPYFKDDPSISTLNGTWKVYCFENLISRTLEFKTHENSRGQDIIVEFDDTKDPKSFSGMKTTNGFAGEFNYVGSRQFKLKKVISTLIGQPPWGDEFDKVISEGHNNEITFTINNDMLCIWYAFKTKTVTLIKQ